MSRESQPRLASDPGARAAIPFFLTTEYTEHTEKNPPTVMSSFRVFGVFRGSARGQWVRPASRPPYESFAP